MTDYQKLKIISKKNSKTLPYQIESRLKQEKMIIFNLNGSLVQNFTITQV